MSDIVMRLNCEHDSRLTMGQDWSDLLLDAANEIERLRSEVAKLSDDALRFILDEAGISQREAEAVELVDLRTRVADLEKALSFYANPEIYEPHPHGPAFDRRDKSALAKSVLAEYRR